MSKPWLVINGGKIPIKKGVFGKNGGEKPHMSFWVDEKEDIRVAIWDNEDGTAYFQITRKNELLETSKVVEPRRDELPLPQTPVVNKSIEDDDLPF